MIRRELKTTINIMEEDKHITKTIKKDNLIEIVPVMEIVIVDIK